MKNYLLKLLLLLTLLLPSSYANAGYFNGGFYSPPFSLDCIGFKSTWSVSVPTNNTIFNPSITVSNTTLAFCVGTRGTITLNAFGQCKAIGLLRTCARFTPPCQYGNNWCCGGNCSVGASNSSCPNCKAESAYRICAFYDLPIPLDPNDNNLNLMPYQKDTPVPPAVKGGSTIAVEGAMLFAAGSLVPGLGLGVQMIGEAMMIAGGIMDLVQVITSVINYTVVANVGCIDVPLGPIPPPFFSSIVGTTPTASASQICQYSPEFEVTTADGYTQEEASELNYKQISTPGTPCEIGAGTSSSPSYSSFENTSIRVFFENALPLCTGNSTSGNLDICVMTNNVASPSSLAQTNNSLLPICSNGITSNCINFPSKKTTGGPYRTYYTLTSNIDGSTGTTTYVDLSNNSNYSLSLASINDNPYIDIVAGGSGTITDYNNTARSFSASIDPTGTQICAYDTTDSTGQPLEVGCFDRPISTTLPTVTPCAAGCDYASSNTASQPIVSVSVGNPAKSGVMGVALALQDPSSTSNPPGVLPPTPFCMQDDNMSNGSASNVANQVPCMIYSSPFSVYLTDQFNSTPANSPTGNGTVTASQTSNNGSSIVTGINYVNGSYCFGATNLCLTGYLNPEQTVVAKTVPITTTVNGLTTTQYQVSNNIQDRIIPPYYNPSNPSQVLYPGAIVGPNVSNPPALFNPDVNYLTSSIPNPTLTIGFIDSGTNTPVANPACTSGTASCVPNSTPTGTSTVPVSCTCTGTSGEAPTSCTIQGCSVAFIASNPSENTTNFLGYQLGSNQYLLYDANGNQAYGERPLNAVEQGLCAPIPSPTCAAIDEDSSGINDGEATWPQTNLNNTATGTCLPGAAPTTTNNTTATCNTPPCPIYPTRTCGYIIDNSNLLPNGCPTSSISFSAVTNPCNATIPAWWPSEFLYGQANFQGAIIDQFYLNPSYIRKIIPKSANSSQINASGIVTSPESWISSGTKYSSCKLYGNSIALKQTPRASIDGDQEMLFITKNNWQAIWNNNNFDWLLSDDNTYNGCYVYNINGMLNAVVADSVTVGLKVCKSQSRISFSLVDLQANNSTGSKNSAYIMQSNIIAYDTIATSNIASVNASGTSFVPQVTLENQFSSSPSTTYPINHGIVIDKNGFAADSLQPGKPPVGFDPITTPESLSVNYRSLELYLYSTSKGHYYTYSSSNTTSTIDYGDGTLSNPNITNNALAYTVNNCALSIYRKAVNYSFPLSGVSYYAMPNNLSQLPGGKRSYPNYSGAYMSSLYSFTTYNGGNSGGSTWPNANYCAMDIQIFNYVPGNSAANTSMFLWSSPTQYDVCNWPSIAKTNAPSSAVVEGTVSQSNTVNPSSAK